MVYMGTCIHESGHESHGHFRSLRISGYQKSLNIPLSYKIRLNQVCAANKIHPYNHFSEYFFVFLQIYCADIELSIAYPPRLQAHHYQMIRS